MPDGAMGDIEVSLSCPGMAQIQPHTGTMPVPTQSSPPTFQTLLLCACVHLGLQVQFSSCPESSSRSCTASSNRTQLLLSMKKGGVDVLSTDVYLYDYFLCQEFNYDCAYIESLESKIMVANGVSLQLLEKVALSAITANPTTYNKIEPYIGQKSAGEALCGLSVFPLALTANESKEVLDGYFSRLQSELKELYDLQRNNSVTKQWGDININIRTAILATIKSQINSERILNNIEASPIWDQVVSNRFSQISLQLKEDYKETDEMMTLHNAYLIDSVTQQCNKMQSVNFLVDHSKSIKEADFYVATRFLELYINSTNDEHSKISIGYFHQTFENSVDYGSTYDQILRAITGKVYSPVRKTNTALGMNATIQKIINKGFSNGLPKIMAVLTDGRAHDDVANAAAWARQLGIHIIAVGIGSRIVVEDLVVTAGSMANVISVNSFDEMPKLVEFITNYFCKQIQDVRLGDYISANYVRDSGSPAYFRVEKSAQNIYYQFQIFFEDDPIEHKQQAYESQIDPFPDELTEYETSQHYEIFYQPHIQPVFQFPIVNAQGQQEQDGDRQLENGFVSNKQVGNGFVPKKIYFIEPKNEIDLVIKKDITEPTNVTVSYFSVGGFNMGFNISLKKCQSDLCEQEREYYKAVILGPDKPITIYQPQQDNLLLFLGIGVTLGALAMLCCICMAGIRRSKAHQDRQSGSLSSEEDKSGSQKDG